jgi:hypothetical protein
MERAQPVPTPINDFYVVVVMIFPTCLVSREALWIVITHHPGFGGTFLHGSPGFHMNADPGIKEDTRFG